MTKRPARRRDGVTFAAVHDRAWRTATTMFGTLLIGAAAATMAFGDSHEEVTVSHGYSNFGELKYGPGEHFAYVNPDAPKGGELSLSTIGNFDSFNNYTRKGVVAANVGLMYENLMISAADDPYGSYCYLCETVEYPESLDWVVVNLRQDVTFSDGTPMPVATISPIWIWSESRHSGGVIRSQRRGRSSRP